MATQTPNDRVRSLHRKPRSLAVRKAAAEVAIDAAKKLGEEPDPELLRIVGRSA